MRAEFDSTQGTTCTVVTKALHLRSSQCKVRSGSLRAVF
jgi:hypothetical protein